MKKGQNPRAKAIFIFTFCLLFCTTLEGRAADEIQLRKYPAPDGPVLDTVLKKTDFKIIESFGPWRYVVIDGSTYGGGWINTEDLKKDADERPASKEGSKTKRIQTKKAPEPTKEIKTVKKPSSKTERALKRETSTGTVRIKPISIRVAEQPVKNKEDHNKTLEPAKLPKTVSKRSTDNDASKILKPSAPTPEKKMPTPQPLKPAFKTATPEGKKEIAKNIPEIMEKELPSVEKAHTNPPENTQVPAQRNENRWNKSVILPATAEASENAVNPPNIEKSVEPTPEEMKRLTPPTEMMEILDIGLRLLTVMMSCFAVIFAYKAKKMADMSYTLTLQLQQNMKIDPGREFNERY